MKRIRRGFTLVEVSLFLAITAAIFVSIAVGTQNSIFQQRYNDAVQNFAEFLRSIYSQVTNVQSEGDGRSGYAIYGKLVNFENDNGNNKITTYNVVGKVAEDDLGNDNVLERLKKLNADVVLNKGDGEKIKYEPVGFVENYRPRWASQIQTTGGWNDDKYNVYTGALLIVRHPSSGTVYTFSSNKSVDVDSYIESLTNGFGTWGALIATNIGNFSVDDVDFCLNPNGAERSTLRRDIRIVAGARNATGVEIIADDENWIGEGANRKNIGDRCE